MSRGRRSAAIVAAVTSIAIGVLVVVTRSGDDDAVDRAIALLGRPSRFDTALEAGDTFAEVGGLLQLEARRCREAGPALRCDQLFSWSAYAQVLAAHVLGCTAPGRHEARVGMLRVLEGEAEALPGLPSC